MRNQGAGMSGSDESFLPDCKWGLLLVHAHEKKRELSLLLLIRTFSLSVLLILFLIPS